VQINFDKIFIAIVALCIACFCAGRYEGSREVSGNSERIIDGIISAGTDTDKIVNELTIAGASVESARKYSQFISGIVDELQSNNEKLGISTNEAVRAIENNTRISELVLSASEELHNTTGNAITDAIKRAEDYERLIESLQEIVRNTPENTE
jgi:hypothetical protein